MLALPLAKSVIGSMKPFGLLVIALGCFLNQATFAGPASKPDIVVAADGSGDFKTIQSALNAIPKTNAERVVILIKNGVYHEKVRVDSSFVTLRGESQTGTQIQYSQPNEDFQRLPDDIGRAVINLNQANDVVLENLNIENTAGVIGPHAFTIYSTGDRGVVIGCSVWSHGADTVSFWLGDRGRSYLANCRIEGSVDFVCPRGWSYATNCTFYEMKGTAAMWHDGSKDRNMKFVLRDCRFDGADGWYLARHHHDAQFYFLDCQFSRTMIDRAPFRVIYPLDGGTPSTNDIQRNKDLDKSNVWGERNYYFHCRRDGGDYSWFGDNLTAAPGSPKPAQMNAAWTFGGTWNPEDNSGPIIKRTSIGAGQIVVAFSEAVTVKGRPRIELSNGDFAGFLSGSGSDTLLFQFPDKSADPVSVDLNGGFIIACQASATTRVVDMSMPLVSRSMDH